MPFNERMQLTKASASDGASRLIRGGVSSDIQCYEPRRPTSTVTSVASSRPPSARGGRLPGQEAEAGAPALEPAP